ncbi:Hypothetical predicted protein [Mytilus galloprovincialis]|uniref:C1q domain-containing protein n=1 Tax=Mytilus galloprovincialis TaxID=29158 RepID=A0A8B6EEZ3_MYTGA|nr:Hypothetical predicted protein [Mytilus galloprovincialis]
MKGMDEGKATTKWNGDEKYEKIFKELNDLRHTTTFLVQQNKLLQQKLAKVEENDSARCEKSRKRFASVDFPSVFFTVENNNDMSLGDNQVIAFDHVVSNEGSGYDTSNGIFTAPTNGVYVFHVQIRGNEDHTCLVDIVKKGNRLISIWLTSNTSDSSMAVVRLNAGTKFGFEIGTTTVVVASLMIYPVFLDFYFTNNVI